MISSITDISNYYCQLHGQPRLLKGRSGDHARQCSWSLASWEQYYPMSPFKSSEQMTDCFFFWSKFYFTRLIWSIKLLFWRRRGIFCLGYLKLIKVSESHSLHCQGTPSPAGTYYCLCLPDETINWLSSLWELWTSSLRDPSPRPPSSLRPSTSLNPRWLFLE